MSSHTYFCQRCGGIRRREMVGWGRGPEHPKDWPRCCEQPMRILRKAYAEAATKLIRADRLRWLRLGMRVYRRAGRRWTAALTPSQIARADEQVAIHKSMSQAAT